MKNTISLKDRLGRTHWTLMKAGHVPGIGEIWHRFRGTPGSRRARISSPQILSLGLARAIVQEWGS